MHIPYTIALWVQYNCIGINNEEWGLAYLASGDSMSAHTVDNWQVAVDFIDRALVCNLIEVHWYAECNDKSSLLAAIRTFSPFTNSGWRLWNVTQIHGTERLSALVDAHFPPGRDTRVLNPAFIEALEQIFADNGVPWSDEPLLPLMPASAEPPAPR